MVAPITLPVAPSRIVARLAAGDTKDATPAEIRTLLDLVVGVDIQATANPVFTGSMTVNEDGDAAGDSRFESDLNTHMFFIDAGNNSVHIDNSLLTGAGDGDLVMGNNVQLGFINNAGTSSAAYGIASTLNDDLAMLVPGAGGFFRFNWVGTPRGHLQEQNSGMGISFDGESSADHAAPAANGTVIYTKDVSGKTALFARFNTGAVQQIAIEP